MSTLLAFVEEMTSDKGPVMRKGCPCHEVIISEKWWKNDVAQNSHEQGHSHNQEQLGYIKLSKLIKLYKRSKKCDDNVDFFAAVHVCNKCYLPWETCNMNISQRLSLLCHCDFWDPVLE